jgi:hypothetical protein
MGEAKEDRAKCGLDVTYAESLTGLLEFCLRRDEVVEEG